MSHHRVPITWNMAVRVDDGDVCAGSLTDQVGESEMSLSLLYDI